LNIEERIERIVRLLDEKKAEEIEVFNLEEIDYIAKRVVIANSLGGKHTAALYDHMREDLKPLGETFFGADESDEWIVVDLGEIIVHLMTPNYRQRYSLEEFLDELRAGKRERRELPL
jgi:ribosome silencing factor RsfS/YbeB/iojap